MFVQKRVLICPLDWGLGHATRCIPIIRLLLQKKAEVLIAADGRSLELLKKEFPNLKFIVLKGYNIQYPDKGSMIFKMFFSIPKIINGIYREHKETTKIIKEHTIDVIISDNRFGCWSKKIKSIFITHQLMIKTPFAEKLLHRINLFFVRKYNECWIPDVVGVDNLSGDLAHKYTLPENTFFIGTLSRFNKPISKEPQLKHAIDATNYLVTHNDERTQYDIMAIISGPEPQRSIFEKLMLEQLKKIKLKTLVVLGKTELEERIDTIENVTIVNHLKSDEMQKAILSAKIIIARSGYSTIMDLATLGKKAIFVPTPGQTEQEYLAEYLMQKNIAYYMSQEQFNLPEALSNFDLCRGFKEMKNECECGLEERINNFIALDSIH